MTRRWFQFNLRFLIALLSIAAIGLAVWSQRPSPHLVVEFDADGSIAIGGRSIEHVAMGDELKSESEYRKMWFTDCAVRICADSDVLASAVQEVVDAAASAGIVDITFTIED